MLHRHWFFGFVTCVFLNGLVTLYLTNAVIRVRGSDWLTTIGVLECLFFLVIALLVWAYSVSGGYGRQLNTRWGGLEGV